MPRSKKPTEEQAAKPSRARPPRPPRVPTAVTFERSDEVRAIALRLLDEWPAKFGFLRQFRLEYIIARGVKPPAEWAIDQAVRAVKANPLWRDLAKVDAAIVVVASVWIGMSEEQRAALVMHGLCHLDRSDKGALTTVGHDLEEFAAVARAYGAWWGNVRQFGDQLGLFELEGPPAAPAPVVKAPESRPPRSITLPPATPIQ